MRSIYKFQVHSGHPLKIPVGSKFLKLGVQSGDVYAWYEVEMGAVRTERHIYNIFGTGWEIPDVGIEYVDTVFIGDFVWHVYKDLPNEVK